MLHVLALLAAAAVEPTVSTAWVQAHLNDPLGMQMNGAAMDHRMLPLPDLAAALAAKAGAADGTHIVLYGDSPMQTGWIYMTRGGRSRG